jgi:hypothetical protein
VAAYSKLMSEREHWVRVSRIGAGCSALILFLWLLTILSSASLLSIGTVHKKLADQKNLINFRAAPNALSKT